MPKKSTTRSGSGAQRNKPKVQKNIELVRPNATAKSVGSPVEVEPEETQLEMESGVEETEGSVSTITATATTTTTSTTTAAPTTTKASATAVAKPRARKAAASETESLSNMVPATETGGAGGATETAPKGSASARLAARRQAAQKTQRVAPTLITAEHYSYVRKDLIYIAVLAILMFATIIVLHFVPGIGA